MPNMPITAGAGLTTVVPAQPGRRVRVLGYVIVGGGTITWQDGAANALSGPMPLGAGGGAILVAPFVPPVRGSDPGWFVTATSQSLVLNIGTGGAANGHLAYDFI